MAAAVFVRALRPAINSAPARFVIFALLLLNPMTWDAATMGRVLRQHVYGPLALLILAGLAALCLRRAESLRRQVPWALLLGLAGSAFYLTREESVWLAPSVLLLVVTAWAGAWQLGWTHLRRTTGALGWALLAAALPVVLVCTMNQRHYDWFGTCEFRAREFQDAYGAMLRVRVGPELAFVPVTREARQAIAAASPTFARVQREFDAGIALGWSGASEFFTGLPPAQEQIGGGWMVWALREAAVRATRAGNARAVLDFYRQMAGEINEACATDRLPAGPPRRGFAPVWRESQAGPFVQAAEEFTTFVISFSRFNARPSPSSGGEAELNLFRDLTGETLTPAEGAPVTRRVAVLQSVGTVMQHVCFYLVILAQAAALVVVVMAVWQRACPFPLVLCAAAGGACTASVLIHAMIQATSFPVLTISSFAPIYPLLLVFAVAAFWGLVEMWRVSVRARAEQPSPPPVPVPAVAGFNRALPWLAGLAALVPFLVWQDRFRELFWFGDDWLLLDQMAAMGFRTWTFRVFSENFVPLFKWLWGGSTLLFGGSYLAMLWLLWLTHALNTVILGRLLQRTGFPLAASLLTLLVFGLTPVNLESLGWSVQWSAVLATMFFLLGLLWHERIAARSGAAGWRQAVPLALLAAASASCFSRGVLTGAILALALLLPLLGSLDLKAWLARLPGAGLCLLPAVAVALVIGLDASGNHRQMGGHWGEALEFAGSFFLLNPFYSLTGAAPLPAVVLVLAGAKVGIIGFALTVSRGRTRDLLLLLLAYDLGNAVLVGIGRYHTGFLASLSSRYQYGSLISSLPALGVLVAWLMDRVLRPVRLRQAGLAGLLILLVWSGLRGWPAELAGFTGWRGTDLRRQLAAPETSDPHATVPTLDFMHIERAKALVRTYGLH